MINQEKVHRKVRLPKDLINILRYIRDATSRSIPKLVNICLKTTAGVSCLDYASTTRDTSETIDLWLHPEYAELEPKEIRSRIAHALIGVNTTIDWTYSEEPKKCPLTKQQELL